MVAVSMVPLHLLRLLDRWRAAARLAPGLEGTLYWICARELAAALDADAEALNGCD